MPTETTQHVSEPLANILDRYLPAKAKETALTALDPIDVLAGLWWIGQQCQANERRLVAEFLAAARSPNPVTAPPVQEPAPYVDPAQMAEEAIDLGQVDREAVAA